jgi:hypothetical protein
MRYLAVLGLWLLLAGGVLAITIKFMAKLNRIFYWTNHVLVFFRSFMVMVTVMVHRWRRSQQLRYSEWSVAMPMPILRTMPMMASHIWFLIVIRLIISKRFRGRRWSIGSAVPYTQDE